ncbi:hypothetical protein PSPO01_05620 [Paraphaeosphaeria sporulosa]
MAARVSAPKHASPVPSVILSRKDRWPGGGHAELEPGRRKLIPIYVVIQTHSKAGDIMSAPQIPYSVALLGRRSEGVVGVESGGDEETEALWQRNRLFFRPGSNGNAGRAERLYEATRRGRRPQSASTSANQGSGGVKELRPLLGMKAGGPATARAVRNADAALLRLGIVQEQIRYRAVAGWHVRGDALGEASLLAGGCYEGIQSASGGEQPPPQLGAGQAIGWLPAQYMEAAGRMHGGRSSRPFALEMLHHSLRQPLESAATALLKPTSPVNHGSKQQMGSLSRVSSWQL